MAGIGAAIYTGQVAPATLSPSSVAEAWGTRRSSGPSSPVRPTIIGVDLDARKLVWAKDFGSDTHGQRIEQRPRRGRQGADERLRADVTIEAVGHPDVMKQAFFSRDLAGTLVQVGVPNPTMMIELPMIEFFGRGGALKPSWYGDCLPTRDFPMLIDLYLQGRLDLDRFVSERIKLDEVEDAFRKMEKGDVLRSVVVFGSEDREGCHQGCVQSRW